MAWLSDLLASLFLIVLFILHSVPNLAWLPIGLPILDRARKPSKPFQGMLRRTVHELQDVEEICTKSL